MKMILTILRLRLAIQNRMRSRRSPRISLFVRIVCETGLLNPIESDILLLIVRIVALASLLSGTFLTPFADNDGRFPYVSRL